MRCWSLRARRYPFPVYHRRPLERRGSAAVRQCGWRQQSAAAQVAQRPRDSARRHERSEKIEIIDSSGNNSIVINTADNTITIAADADIAIQSQSGTLQLSGNGIELTSQAGVTIKASQNMDVQASAQLNLKGAWSISISTVERQVMGQPAARVADMTSHGTPLSPGPGSTNVFIGGMPAWRATADLHTCPLVTGVVPHVGGTVPLGSVTVMINSLQAVRQGDMIVESGPPNSIAGGCPSVMIG